MTASTASVSAGKAPLSARRAAYHIAIAVAPCRPATNAATARRSCAVTVPGASGTNNARYVACAWRRASGLLARIASKGDPGVIPISASMTSASVPDVVIVFLAEWSRETPDSRRMASPAERGRHHLRDQFDRSENEGMWRIDRMDLNRDIRYAGERAVRLERGDHIICCAEMSIHGCDHRVQRSISGGPARLGQPRAMPPKADFGEAQGFLVVVGHEHGARREDTGLAALGQRLEVRVDQGVLDLGQRQVG